MRKSVRVFGGVCAVLLANGSALAQTAARHRVLIERLEARDGQGLAAALGHHIDTIVDVAAERAAS